MKDNHVKIYNSISEETSVLENSGKSYKYYTFVLN